MPVPTADQIRAFYSGILGGPHHAGSHRDEDVKAPITGTLLKWRDHDWHTSPTAVEVSAEYHVTIRYSWTRRTQYFSAPGVKTSNDDVANGTGSVEFDCDVTTSGKAYVNRNSFRLTGDEGPTEGPIIGFVISRDGQVAA